MIETSQATLDAERMLAEAAALGPGYRGERYGIPDAERVERAKDLMLCWDSEVLGSSPCRCLPPTTGA